MSPRDGATVVAASTPGARLPTVTSLRRRFYPDAVSRDPVARFVNRLDTIVKPGHRVLDIGAGAGELNAYALKGRVRQIVGVDLDPRVSANPLLDAGLSADIYALPFRDNSFDVVFSIYVLEHVNSPARLTAEIARVLRPGGVCLFLTPNVFHYVTMASRLTPTSFHRWANERRGRASDDTFPTCYQLNSRRALERHFSAAGLHTVAIEAIEVQPNYLTFSPLAYLLGVGYERMVNATELLSAFRVNLIGLFRKPIPTRCRPSQGSPKGCCQEDFFSGLFGSFRKMAPQVAEQ
jgi:SAM-dependent methyltransferase